MSFYNMTKLTHIKNLFNLDLTEEELDKEIWKNTKYAGMKFVRESGWDDYDKTYASPVFSFENGDRVVFNKYGCIEVL